MRGAVSPGTEAFPLDIRPVLMRQKSHRKERGSGRLRSIVLIILFCGLAGCSRSQKTGKSISAQDIAAAMPEFKLVPAPGAVNVLLEQDNSSTPLLASVYYKVTVPRAAVSNYLFFSGFSGEFVAVPALTNANRGMPLPQGLGAGGAISWMADAKHAAGWDVYRRNAPYRMTSVETRGKASAAQRVFLIVYVDDSASNEAPIYFEYHRLDARAPRRW